MEASTPQPIASLSLSDLRETFALKRDRFDPFFEQWLAGAEHLSNFEQQALARLKRNYENIIETNPLEEVVKLVVVAPLLDLAGFYQPPFSIRTEVSTKLDVTCLNSLIPELLKRCLSVNIAHDVTYPQWLVENSIITRRRLQAINMKRSLCDYFLRRS